MITHNYDFSLEDLHLIKMERNSYSGVKREMEINEQMGMNIYDIKQFYLFDYFDRLAYVRKYKDGCDESQLSYADCFGTNKLIINEHTPPALARLLFSLVHYSHVQYNRGIKRKEANPFEYPPTDVMGESALPFLALMFITISVDSTNEIKENQVENGDFSFIGKLVSSCISELKRAIHYILKTRYGHKKTKPIFSIFQTVNTNDLCIVLRTADAVDAYEVTYHLTQLHNYRNKGKNTIPFCEKLKGIVYSSFTTIGLEYGCNSEELLKVYSGLYEEGKHTRNTNVVLRLQICNDADKSKIISEYGSLNAVDGLYGRYNFTLTLSMEEFFLLYPVLSAYKFGEYVSIEKWEETSRKLFNEFFSGEPEKEYRINLIEKIAHDIVKNNISVVNERIVVNIESITPKDKSNTDSNANNGYSTIYERQDIGLIDSLINEQKNRLKILAAKECELKAHRYAYKEAIRQLYELHRTYSNLWYQTDTRINGNLFYVQMNIIIGNIESNISKIIDMTLKVNTKDSEKNLNDLLKNVILSIRKSVNAMNNFNKLLQSVNQQTIQAPNYEIQTEVDIEKFIVAYSEFLRSICREHTTNHQDNVILPIFTVDIATDMLNTETLFDKFYLDSPDYIDETVVVHSINTPNIESFARMFETVPQLCHEISHGLHLCENYNQNRALIYILICDISALVCERLFFENKVSYDKKDELFMLYQEAVFEVLFNEFNTFLQYKIDGENVSNRPIQIFKDEFVKYYTMTLFSKAGYKQLGAIVDPHEGENMLKVILSNMQDLYRFAKNHSLTNSRDLKRSETKSKILTETLEEGRSVIIKIHEIIRKNPSNGDEYNQIDITEIIENAWNLHLLAVVAIAESRLYKIYNEIDNFDFYPDFKVDKVKEMIGDLITILRNIGRDNAENQYSKFYELTNKLEKVLSDSNILNCDINKSISNDIRIIKSCFFIEIINEFTQFVSEIKQIQFSIREINVACESFPNAPSELLHINRKKEKTIIAIADNIGKKLAEAFDENGLRAALITYTQPHNLKSVLLNCSRAERKELIDSALGNISFSHIKSYADYSMSFYKETVADLGMCVICGFDAFGYIKFYTDQLSIDENYQNLNQPDSSNRNRVKYVISVLMRHQMQDKEGIINNSQINMNEVIYKAISYIRNLNKLIIHRIQISTEERLHYVDSNIEINEKFADVDKKIAEYCENYINALEQIHSNGRINLDMCSFVTLKDILDTYIKCLENVLSENDRKIKIAAQLCENSSSEENYKLYIETFAGEIIKHIARMISRVECIYVLIEGICPNGMMDIDKTLHQFFWEVYIRNAPREQFAPYASWERQPRNNSNKKLNHVRQSIRDYYNDAHLEGDKFEHYQKRFAEHKMFLETVSFALMYYYKNRYYYSDYRGLSDYMAFYRRKKEINKEKIEDESV